MVKKCMLTGGLVLVAPGTSDQVMFGALIALTYLLLVLKASPYEENEQDDDTATECFLCGGHINAGTDPPVCKACGPEFVLECILSRALREYEAMI